MLASRHVETETIRIVRPSRLRGVIRGTRNVATTCREFTYEPKSAIEAQECHIVPVGRIWCAKKEK